MKIVHVINYFQPKLGYQETFLAREQIRMGHEVYMIASDRYYPFPDFEKTYAPLLGSRRRPAGFSIEEGISTYRLKTLFDIRCRVWLINLEKTVRFLDPDLVISHAVLSNSFRLAKMRLRGARFKLIVDDHMDIFARDDIAGKIYYALKRMRAGRELVPWVDKFVGVSRQTCRHLEEKDGIPKEKITCIPLGSDSRLYQYDRAKREAMRHRLGIADNDVLIVYTGKYNFAKGVDTLAAAFNKMETCRVFLLLVGGGTAEFKQRLIDCLSPEKRKRMLFQPFVPAAELPAFYSAADICVWPKETSTSILDAMSCQRPVVGCDVEAVRERLVNDNGLTYQTGNAEALAEKLDYLCRHEEVRYEMGRRGRELIEKRFSWEIIAQKFIDCAG